MIDDILQEMINQKTNNFCCDNCSLSYCMNYDNNNKICSGVVKKVNPNVPYDVIRLCIETNEGLQPYDYTPDEANSIVSVLSQSIGDWLSSSKAYQKFRIPKHEKKQRTTHNRIP